MRGEQQILAFNRGMISRLAMARVDLKRYPMSAEEQTNFIPRVLGSAMLRPGFGYLGATRSNLQARNLPFVFSSTDTALIELTDQKMRIRVNDALLSRATVATAIANGSFTSNLTSWTDADEAGSASVWVAGGYMGLTGNGTTAAIRTQVVAVGSAGVVHALRVVVTKGPVELIVSNSSPAISTTLATGVHSIAFTPTAANFTISLRATVQYQALVESIAIESAGVIELPAPWTEDDLPMVRQDQSGDVLFVACEGYQQRRIERRGPTSWSIVLYQPTDGPFMVQNTSRTTITPSALSGNVTLTASNDIFSADMVGALIAIDSVGQAVNTTGTANNDATNHITITGVGGNRQFGIVITGNASGSTVDLQQSYDEVSWINVSGQQWTANVSTVYNDGLDNQIVYYRLILTTRVAPDAVGMAMSIGSGSIRGIARITAYTNPTTVLADVLSDFGQTIASTFWREGLWSEKNGWPSAVAFYEGRLWWAGKDKWFGSVTDDFESFDPDYEGDAGPIIRSIGSGPVDVINWLLPLSRLMAGTDGNVVAGRSSSFDEPLTPSNFNPKEMITQGCARVPAIKVDGAGVFVQRAGFRIYSMAYSVEANDFQPEDLAVLIPEIGKPGIIQLAAQRQPDTRMHCVRSDGKVAMLVFDKAEDVKCWVLVETDGVIEDVAILPGSDEDAVYYVVKRNINGVDVRYLERWAREEEAIGAAVTKLADSWVAYNGSNLTHLEGESVVGWYDGVAYDAVTVSAGAADGIPVGAIVGLTYRARFKSTKLAFLAQPGDSGLATRKRAHSLSLVLADTHPQGLRYGKDFDTMDDLPLMEAYAEVDPDAVWDSYNYEAFSLPGEWGVDSRLCLEANAPRPCTLLAAVVGMNANATS
jgi:hypothetical protein